VITVWDLPVRLLHWTLVVSVTLCWISTLGWGLSRWHEPAGYVAAAAVIARLLWGFAGSRYARFRQFVAAPRQLLDYVAALRTRREPRYMGHNPLGGWMVLLLLAMTAAVAATGWLFTTDRFWGVNWVAELHNGLAWLLLALIALHIAGVIFTSLRHRENLPGAMLTGRKRAARQGDVD